MNAPTGMSCNDELLVRQSLTGNSEALATLLRRHRPVVFRHLSRYSLPIAERDQLIDTILKQIVRRLDTVPADGEFSNWLYRLTAATAHMHMRMRQSA